MGTSPCSAATRPSSMATRMKRPSSDGRAMDVASANGAPLCGRSFIDRGAAPRGRGPQRARPAWSGLSFEEGRQALTHTDAHRRDAIPPLAPLELAEERPRETRPRRTDRMTDGDRTTVRVRAIVRQAERTHARDDLRRKGLVQLDHVALRRRDSGPLHELADRGDRPEAHVVGMHAGRGARDDAAERTQAERLCLLAGRDQQRGCAVVDAGRVARRDGAALFEGWFELLELLDGAVGARMLVLADELSAVVDLLDLAGKETVGLRARIAGLAA